MHHCVKNVQIQSFFWSVFSRTRTRKNSVFGHFSHSMYCSVHLKWAIFAALRNFLSQRRMQNPAKHLRWSLCPPSTLSMKIFLKRFVFAVGCCLQVVDRKKRSRILEPIGSYTLAELLMWKHQISSSSLFVFVCSSRPLHRLASSTPKWNLERLNKAV